MAVTVRIRPSNRRGKKMMAEFSKGGKVVKTTHFGASGASDFTKHQDEDRKRRYLDRHRANEDWDDYTSAGSLARHILWNKPTLEASTRAFKRKFRLK